MLVRNVEQRPRQALPPLRVADERAKERYRMKTSLALLLFAACHAAPQAPLPPTGAPTPADFVTDGALHLQGVGHFDGAEQKVVKLDTPSGEASLRMKYMNVSGAWIFAVNGHDVLTSIYDADTTTAGNGDPLDPTMVFEFDLGYDAARGLAYERIGFNGSMTTTWTTEGVTETIATPTAVTTIATRLSARPYFDAAPVLLIGDSQQDLTGAAPPPAAEVKPSQHFFTLAEIEAGMRVENLSVHGGKFDFEWNRLQAFLAAFPETAASARLVIADLGWNNFSPQGTADIDAEAMQLFNGIRAVLPDAQLDVYVPSPAKGFVSPHGYGEWKIFQANALGGRYAQATNVYNVLAQETAPSMNAVAFGGEMDYLYEPYSHEGLHYSDAGKKAKAEMQRERILWSGVIQ